MILDTLLAQLAPHECLGCSAEGSLLCLECQQGLSSLPERCYRCKALSAANRTCSTCRNHSVLYAVHARTVYDGAAKDLVWQLKFQGAQAAARHMAAMLAALAPTGEDIIFVPVPTATSRMRRRGYDQATLLARALARHTKTPYATALRRLGQHHQVGASRQQRITQLQSAYRCVRPSAVEGRHVVLIDDVLTTGATLEAAAKVIKAAGAKRVSGLVFAQA